MATQSQGVSAEKLLEGDRNVFQIGWEILRGRAGKFHDQFRNYVFTQVRYPGFFKRVARRIDRRYGTSWEAFFHNCEIRCHRNDYQVPPRARVFIHVPRTGGTSVGDYLKEIQAPRVLNLHSHHAVSVAYPPSDHRYFTILRNPVERCWSFYRLTLHGKSGTPYRQAAERGLEHFCEHCWEMRNLYCRYYSGSPWQEPGEETLSEAVRQLGRFEAVLDFGDLEGQMHKLTDRWGLRGTAFVHRNCAPGPEMALDEISQSVLENYNQLDLRLYRQFVGGFIRGFSPIQKLSYDADTPENAIPALVYQA
jgi:hypothetical protein